MSKTAKANDGAQTGTEDYGPNTLENPDVDVEWYRAEVALVQNDAPVLGDSDAPITFTLILVANGEKTVVEAGRIYVDGGRDFIGSSKFYDGAVSVVVTEGPDGVRNADIHPQGTLVYDDDAGDGEQQ